MSERNVMTAQVNGGMAGGWVVLMVDDTPDNLVVARAALEFHGAEVHTASSAAAGLALLKRLKPTVILLDLRMPGMDGWDMFAALRANPDTAPTPVIAVTAYAMTGDRERILDTGFDGYIPKPFDLFNFVGQVHDILREHAAARRSEGQGH
jgi:two-component system cell cycle response regulator DivK